MSIIKSISSFFRRVFGSAAEERNAEKHYFETGRKGNITVEGSMLNNLKEGRWRYFNSLGSLIIEEEYSQGKLQGRFRSFYPSGKLMAEGMYASGKRNGIFTIFNEDGSVKETLSFRNDKLEG